MPVASPDRHLRPGVAPQPARVGAVTWAGWTSARRFRGWDEQWNRADLFGGPPDLIVRSTPYTLPALAQDHWWKPVVPTGLTEDRWVRAIEMRPSTVAGRRITHHALAHLQQEEDDQESLALASGLGAGLLKEWAVGKQGEIMRENSGKLIKAGSSIVFDIHYSATGEEVTDSVELGLYFYPKGQEP